MPTVETHGPSRSDGITPFRQEPLSSLVFVLFQALAEQHVGIVCRTGIRTSHLTKLLAGDVRCSQGLTGALLGFGGEKQ